MSRIKVYWANSSTQEGGKCDFCSGPLAGQVPLLRMAVVCGLPGETLVQGGPWAACGRCQGLMGIEPGAGEVELEQVRRRHQEEADRFFSLEGRTGLRPLFRSEVYGWD